MMQSCASTAKFRGGGPILSRGAKAKSTIGLPPPRLVIRSQSEGDRGFPVPLRTRELMQRAAPYLRAQHHLSRAARAR